MAPDADNGTYPNQGRRRTPEGIARRTEAYRARERALRRVSARYKSVYLRYYAEELERERGSKTGTPPPGGGSST